MAGVITNAAKMRPKKLHWYGLLNYVSEELAGSK